jgi:hypothetical protein
MPSLLQSRYSTFVTWVGKKSEPLTTVLSTMEEVDAPVLYLCNMGGQVIRTDHPSAAGPFTLCLVYPLLKLWLKNSL